MAGVAPTDLEAHRAEREVELVVDHEELGGVDLEERHRRRDAPAGVVHEGHRLEEHRRLGADPRPGVLAGELLLEGIGRDTARQHVGGHEADVVPVRRVLAAGVA